MLLKSDAQDINTVIKSAGKTIRENALICIYKEFTDVFSTIKTIQNRPTPDSDKSVPAIIYYDRSGKADCSGC